MGGTGNNSKNWIVYYRCNAMLVIYENYIFLIKAVDTCKWLLIVCLDQRNFYYKIT